MKYSGQQRLPSRDRHLHQACDLNWIPGLQKKSNSTPQSGLLTSANMPCHTQSKRKMFKQNTIMLEKKSLSTTEQALRWIYNFSAYKAEHKPASTQSDSIRHFLWQQARVPSSEREYFSVTRMNVKWALCSKITDSPGTVPYPQREESFPQTFRSLDMSLGRKEQKGNF